MSKSKSNKKKLRIIYNILIVLFACIFIGCAIYLGKYFYGIRKSEKIVDNLKDKIIEDDSDEASNEALATLTDGDKNGTKSPIFVNVDGKPILKKFSDLYSENNDFVGWLTIPGTNVDYPVMQTMDDEEFYLYKDFEKNYSSSGSLFVDTDSDIEKPSDVILIYGHHMKVSSMFHNLLDYEDEEFYKEHKTITFDTIYGYGTYEVIAAFRDKIYDKDYTGIKYYNFFNAENKQQFDEYIAYCKAKTPYTINATAEYGDKLICLSTCAYHETNGRYVVLAKKIE